MVNDGRVLALQSYSLEAMERLAQCGELENMPKPVDRIVLFIDDLDRCPASRVVKVLEVIHLLLAIPNVCALCSDAPCIAACPIEKELTSGNKALYRNRTTGVIMHDSVRCTVCGACTDACRKAVLVQGRDTGQPSGLCTLCDGDPACVRHRPYDALVFEAVATEDTLHWCHPDLIAEQLIRNTYATERRP